MEITPFFRYDDKGTLARRCYFFSTHFPEVERIENAYFKNDLARQISLMTFF